MRVSPQGQRGLLPLHASVVAIGQRAVAFTGSSGAGKSTLALAREQRGHATIGDDLCAIRIDRDTPVTSTGVTRLKLWAPSLHAAGQRTDGLDPIAARHDKYHWPASTPTEDVSLPLAAIVQLGWSDNSVTAAPLRGADAVGTLVSNTFRGALVEPIAPRPSHLATLKQSRSQAASCSSNCADELAFLEQRCRRCHYGDTEPSQRVDKARASGGATTSSKPVCTAA